MLGGRKVTFEDRRPATSVRSVTRNDAPPEGLPNGLVA